jgi:hypothetical protein
MLTKKQKLITLGMVLLPSLLLAADELSTSLTNVGDYLTFKIAMIVLSIVATYYLVKSAVANDRSGIGTFIYIVIVAIIVSFNAVIITQFAG